VYFFGISFAMSQSFTVPSVWALARVLPSGLNAMEEVPDEKWIVPKSLHAALRHPETMKKGRAGLQSSVDRAPAVVRSGLRRDRVAPVPGWAWVRAVFPLAPVLCPRAGGLFFRAAVRYLYPKRPSCGQTRLCQPTICHHVRRPCSGPADLANENSPSELPVVLLWSRPTIGPSRQWNGYSPRSFHLAQGARRACDPDYILQTVLTASLQPSPRP